MNENETNELNERRKGSGMNATMERTREMKEAWMEEHQGGWCDGTPAAEGLYKGAKVINVFVGLGMRRRKFQSQEIEEVDLVVVRLGWRDGAGEPYRYETGPMKISSSPRSALCRFLRELLGREVRGIVRPEGLRKLKGMPCQVTVGERRRVISVVRAW